MGEGGLVKWGLPSAGSTTTTLGQTVLEREREREREVKWGGNGRGFIWIFFFFFRVKGRRGGNIRAEWGWLNNEYWNGRC